MKIAKSALSGIWTRIEISRFNGPEKVRLFKIINIPSLFPTLSNKEQLQSLWVTFFELINTINEEHCNPDEIDVKTKGWVN